jgi:hypothetical protein
MQKKEERNNKKAIEIRWGDISHISNKGDGCPFRPQISITYSLINIFIT